MANKNTSLTTKLYFSIRCKRVAKCTIGHNLFQGIHIIIIPLGHIETCVEMDLCHEAVLRKTNW